MNGGEWWEVVSYGRYWRRVQNLEIGERDRKGGEW